MKLMEWRERQKPQKKMGKKKMHLRKFRPSVSVCGVRTPFGGTTVFSLCFFVPFRYIVPSVTLFTFTRRQDEDDDDRKSGKKKTKRNGKLFAVPSKTKAEIRRNAVKWWPTRKKWCKVLNIFCLAFVAVFVVCWRAHLESCIINVQFSANQS